VEKSFRGRVSRGRAFVRRWWAGLAAVSAVALLSAGAPVASANPGTLDLSFGVDGALRTNLGGTYDWAYATAIQPDGRILAAGVSNARGTYDFALASVGEVARQRAARPVPLGPRVTTSESLRAR
jgi:hypothetical protein